MRPLLDFDITIPYVLCIGENALCTVYYMYSISIREDGGVIWIQKTRVR